MGPRHRLLSPPPLVMDKFTIPKDCIDEISKLKKSQEHRKTHDDDIIRKVCDHARHNGISSAQKKFGIGYSCVYRWFEEFKKSQFKTYPTNSVRGRKDALNEGQKRECLEAFDKVRGDYKEQVLGGLMSAVAKGVMLRAGAAQLVEHGGTLVLGSAWAVKFLKRNGASTYAATTDRTVPASTIKAEGPPFYAAIHNTKAPIFLVFNMDEFFSLLGNSSGRWTWHRCSQKRCVPLRDTKLGFTMSVLTSADGTLHLCQMIWQGKTEVCHAQVDDERKNPRIFQQHQPESHFQTQLTWKKFFNEFLKVVDKVRAEHFVDDLTPACLIVDAAPQHLFDEEMLKQCAEKNIFVVRVPVKQTHIFQPADQFVIAVLKAMILRAWYEYVALVMANYATDDALKMMYTKNTTHLKKIKYELVSKAIEQVSTQAIRASWEVTGILRESFGIPTERHVSFDDYSAASGETVVVEDEDMVVVSSDSDDDDESVAIDVSQLVPPIAATPHVPSEFILRPKPTKEMKDIFKEETKNRRKIVGEEGRGWKTLAAIWKKIIVDEIKLIQNSEASIRRQQEDAWMRGWRVMSANEGQEKDRINGIDPRKKHRAEILVPKKQSTLFSFM